DRLRGLLRGSDVAARLGDDELVVLCRGVGDPLEASGIATRALDAFKAPFFVGEADPVRVGVSVGVALCGDASTSGTELRRDAGLALLEAKRLGRGRVEIAEPRLRDEVAHRTRIAREVAAAIGEDRLVLHYQPVIDLLDGSVRGYEALVRLRSADGSLI